MATTRRWFQFSLRALFVLTAALAVWLGIVVNRAREQREAVKVIEALDGTVFYDWQESPRDPLIFPDEDLVPSGPAWLRQFIGDDFFQDVWQVDFGSPIVPTTRLELSKAIPYLQRLRTLNRIRVFSSTNLERQRELKAALPNCDLQLFTVDNSRFQSPMPIRN